MCHGPQKAYATYKTRPMLQRLYYIVIIILRSTGRRQFHRNSAHQ